MKIMKCEIMKWNNNKIMYEIVIIIMKIMKWKMKQ